jgi:hypothetical protein
MYKYIDSNSDRIGLFKQGLYNLDCYQIANRDYYITDCGFCKSLTSDSVGHGRLGFVQAWELRPIKPTFYNLVNTNSQLGFTQRRRTKLRDLFTLDYNEDKHKILRRGPSYGYLWSWDVLVKEYLLSRQSYRDSIKGSVIGPLSAYYPEDLDVINILLSVSKYSPDWHRAVRNKKQRRH